MRPKDGAFRHLFRSVPQPQVKGFSCFGDVAQCQGSKYADFARPTANVDSCFHEVTSTMNLFTVRTKINLIYPSMMQRLCAWQQGVAARVRSGLVTR